MPKMSLILQARVLELSAEGISNRKIAQRLGIGRHIVTGILSGPTGKLTVAQAWERARQMVEKRDAARADLAFLHGRIKKLRETGQDSDG